MGDSPGEAGCKPGEEAPPLKEGVDPLTASQKEAPTPQGGSGQACQGEVAPFDPPRGSGGAQPDPSSPRQGWSPRQGTPHREGRGRPSGVDAMSDGALTEEEGELALSRAGSLPPPGKRVPAKRFGKARPTGAALTGVIQAVDKRRPGRLSEAFRAGSKHGQPG